MKNVMKRHVIFLISGKFVLVSAHKKWNDNDLKKKFFSFFFSCHKHIFDRHSTTEWRLSICYERYSFFTVEWTTLISNNMLLQLKLISHSMIIELDKLIAKHVILFIINFILSRKKQRNWRIYLKSRITFLKKK